MNVSINILFVAHQRHNMPQLLGRKFFRQFFHLPLTGLATQTSPLSEFSKTKGKKTVLGHLLFSVPCNTCSHDLQHTWALDLDLDLTLGLDLGVKYCG